LSLYGAGYTIIARYTVSKICRRLQWIKKILIESSLDRKSSWAIVRDGTVAEFSITNTDEPKEYFDQETNNLTVETERAILKLNLDETCYGSCRECILSTIITLSTLSDTLSRT
jgi:hypothetical protein